MWSEDWDWSIVMCSAGTGCQDKLKYYIDKTSESPLCRLCGKKCESVQHLVCGCEKLAEKEYKRRHDNVAKEVQWDFCKKNGLEHTEKWYKHVPEGVVQNEEIKVQCDNVIEARRPDIIVIDKKERKRIIIDIAKPADVRVGEKEREKVGKYQDLKREIGRLWQLKMVEVVPVVIEALGSVTKGFDRWIENLGIPLNVGVMQKTALLGTARIFKKVLEMWRRDNSVSLWSFVMTRLTEENTVVTMARTWC